MHPTFYDPETLKPSALGNDYLLPIFTGCMGTDDVETLRKELFDPGKLLRPYHSVNTEIHKRIRYLG